MSRETISVAVSESIHDKFLKLQWRYGKEGVPLSRTETVQRLVQDAFGPGDLVPETDDEKFERLKGRCAGVPGC